MADKEYDRASEDLGNIVNLGHVNVCVSDQHLATHYYVTGLGLTRDPFLNTGARLMWINVSICRPARPISCAASPVWSCPTAPRCSTGSRRCASRSPARSSLFAGDMTASRPHCSRV